MTPKHARVGRLVFLGLGACGVIAAPLLSSGSQVTAAPDRRSVVAGLLPAGARIIEIQPLSGPDHRSRTLVLWMISPSDSGCSPDPTEPYAPSAVAVTRGCCWSGPTRLSLLADDVGAVKQTYPIKNPFSTTDTFELPYMLERGGPYKVSRRFAKPTLLWLRDYNGDGRSLEVAFFTAESSSDLLTTVFGYEPEQDVLIQYGFHVSITDPDGKHDEYDSEWLQGLFWFNNGPRRPPGWHFQAAYPGGPHEFYR